MNEEIEGYIGYKAAQFIIFSTDLFEKNNEFYAIETLELIKKVIETLAKYGYIISTVKDEIFKFLSNARDMNDIYREKRIEIINDIITILNNQVENKYLDFYRTELIKRKGSIKYAFLSTEDISKFINFVNYSIVFDSVVLNSFDEEVSDEEFIQEHLPELSGNPYYIDSINAIIDECPELFTNLTFYNRNMLILNSLDEDIYVNNKKLVKKIVKKVRKIK